jgi:hypothetical protein
MYTVGDLAQVIDQAHELRGDVRHPGTDLVVFRGCRNRAAPEGQRDEALLCAVVQIALDAPTALIGCGDYPRTRGIEFSPALRVRDRRCDQVGELRHPLLGVGRQWPLTRPDGDHSPQSAVDMYRHRDRGAQPLPQIRLPALDVVVVIDTRGQPGAQDSRGQPADRIALPALADLDVGTRRASLASSVAVPSSSYLIILAVPLPK